MLWPIDRGTEPTDEVSHTLRSRTHWASRASIAPGTSGGTPLAAATAAACAVAFATGEVGAWELAAMLVTTLLISAAMLSSVRHWKIRDAVKQSARTAMSSTFFVQGHSWLLRIANSFRCFVISRRAPANPQGVDRIISATWAAVAGVVEEPVPPLARARALRVPAGEVAPGPAAVLTGVGGNGATPSGGGEGLPAEDRPRPRMKTARVAPVPSPALVTPTS